MKRKIFCLAVALCLIFSLLTGFTACTKPSDNSSSSAQGGGSSSGGQELPDNTAASKDHSKILYYSENNVAYDDGNDCYEYCFMTPYLAARPTGGAVLVFPGGAYSNLSNSHRLADGTKTGTDNDGDQKESSSIAKFYNAQGISVFIVNYRTKSVEKNISYKQILSDATRALKYVSKNADKYYVKKDKIAVQGYSAGGHLASVMVTKGCFDIADPTYVKDEIDEEKAVVSAGVLCYPVITLAESYTHKTTAKNFSGGDSAIKTEYSSEKNVTASTAPCFLWCHDKDGTVSSENTRAMQTALLEKNVECEVHIFDDNGATDHGIGIAENFEEAKAWTSLATAFLKSLGF